MRSDQEILDLILNTARDDSRIRAVILSGSRTNPNVAHDVFQDFDVLYLVTNVKSFLDEQTWTQRFGETIIVQTPDAMLDSPSTGDGRFAYLMLFTDGNRIDLTLFPLDSLNQLHLDSLSVILLDKDQRLEQLPPPSDLDYVPAPPTPQAFADCCNEFFWCCPGVAKGLWRDELPYAKEMSDLYVRKQLMRMLTWHVGIKTNFRSGPGKFGKYMRRYLEPELWVMLQKTYSDANFDRMWDALFMMCELFRITAIRVAEHYGFTYSYQDDEKVTEHLRHVRSLPENASEIY